MARREKNRARYLRGQNAIRVIELMELAGEATPRKVVKHLQLSNKQAHRVFERLAAAGVVVNQGKPRYPNYRLAPYWKRRTSIKAEKPPAARQKITEECRQSTAMKRVLSVYGVGL